MLGNFDGTFIDLLLEYWLCGLLGGLLYDLLRHKGIVRRPTYSRETGEIRLGTLANMVIGVGAAMLLDGKPQTAFAAAIAGPVVLENAVGLIVQRWIGRSTSQPKPVEE